MNVKNIHHTESFPAPLCIPAHTGKDMICPVHKVSAYRHIGTYRPMAAKNASASLLASVPQTIKMQCDIGRDHH